jgi:hypothetical protein
MGAAIALPATVMNWRRLMGLLAGRGSNLTTDRGVFAQKSANVRVGSGLCENSDPQLARRISFSISSITGGGMKGRVQG